MRYIKFTLYLLTYVLQTSTPYPTPIVTTRVHFSPRHAERHINIVYALVTVLSFTRLCIRLRATNASCVKCQALKECCLECVAVSSRVEELLGKCSLIVIISVCRHHVINGPVHHELLAMVSVVCQCDVKVFVLLHVHFSHFILLVYTACTVCFLLGF